MGAGRGQGNKIKPQTPSRKPQAASRKPQAAGRKPQAASRRKITTQGSANRFGAYREKIGATRGRIWGENVTRGPRFFVAIFVAPANRLAKVGARWGSPKKIGRTGKKLGLRREGFGVKMCRGGLRFYCIFFVSRI